MAYAAVANCPVFGGKLKSYDFSAISGRRGIIAAVPVTNGVAVVADNFWRAKEALAKRCRSNGTSARPLRPTAPSSPPNTAPRSTAPLADGGGHGDIAAAFAKPAKVVEAVYEVPYLAHAPMEPLNATAHWRPDRIDVWMGTQDPEFRASARGQGGRGRSEGGLRPQLLPRRRVRPARGQRRTDPGGRGLQGPQAPDQADLDPRRGHPLGPLPAAGGAANARRARARTARPPASTSRTAVGSITRSLGWGKVENGVERQAIEGLSNCPYRATR